MQDLKLNTLGETKGWRTLYNANHTYQGNGYHYSQFVNHDRLNIRFRSSYDGGDGKTKRGKEPYIIRNIGSRLGSNRLRPGDRARKDNGFLTKMMLDQLKRNNSLFRIWNYWNQLFFNING